MYLHWIQSTNCGLCIKHIKWGKIVDFREVRVAWDLYTVKQYRNNYTANVIWLQIGQLQYICTKIIHTSSSYIWYLITIHFLRTRWIQITFGGVKQLDHAYKGVFALLSIIYIHNAFLNDRSCVFRSFLPTRLTGLTSLDGTISPGKYVFSFLFFLLPISIIQGWNSNRKLIFFM